MRNPELRPCPMCGERAELHLVHGESYPAVRCTGCGLHLEVRYGKQHAADAWNRRAVEWRIEVPAEPGFYWVKYRNGEVNILEACEYGSHWRGEKEVTVRLSWRQDRFEPLTVSALTKGASHFAGPLPLPAAPGEGES